MAKKSDEVVAGNNNKLIIKAELFDLNGFCLALAALKRKYSA